MTRFLAIALFSGLLGATSARAAVFFEERFENPSFASRGWYDGAGPALSTSEHLPNGTRSAQYRWRGGARTPDSGGAIRRKFGPSESVYVRYWVKYSTNYTGSNKPYHPHEFNLLTTADGDYVGPAFTHLTGYIEHNEGVPVLALQDGANIDQNRIGQDLRGVTENRSVAGCNGENPDGFASVSCYLSGNLRWNGKVWKADAVYFKDAPGPYYKSDWHQVEAFFKLNSISNGIGLADGQLKYWHDGRLVINRTNVLMRTGANPNLRWNQFMIAPYIGDGSPADQTMWLEDLMLASVRPIADQDRDGLPDEWEIENGLDPSDGEDARGDLDEDGLTNLAEFQAGTDPRLFSSSLRVHSAALSEGRIRITFDSVEGKGYQIERASDLVNGPWSRAGPPILGTGSSMEVVDENVPSSKHYYRVKLASGSPPAAI